MSIFGDIYVVLVSSCMCKGSQNIIKIVFMNKSQILLHISIYIKETGRNSWPTATKPEFDWLWTLVTGRAKRMIKRIRNNNNNNNKELRKHSVAQQSPHHQKDPKITISKNKYHNIIISIKKFFFVSLAVYKPVIKCKNKSS